MPKNEVPEPFCPPPVERPLVTKTLGRYSIWNGNTWTGSWGSLHLAMTEARHEYVSAARSTEYWERREALARFLLDLVYGDGAWVEADKDLILNYRLDADDIIKANPHLLSLEERERLEHLIPELKL